MNEQFRAGRELLARVAAELEIDQSIVRRVPEVSSPVPLPSRLAVGALAWASVTAAALASRPEQAHRASPDPHRIAVAYRSDRVLRVGGVAPAVWSPYSGFWKASDGWIRTHGNYPHHARALRYALTLPDDADESEIRDVLAHETVEDSVDRVTRAGGVAVAVSAEDPQRDAALRAHPLIGARRIGDATPRRLPRTPRPGPHAAAPLEGIRVLDLTRVIAGPVCTRTLALCGADVLRIDPPQLPEIEWQHLDTGHGKRTAVLDATSTQMAELLEFADVIVLGYRPASLARLGLSPECLASRYPGLIIAELSAWGSDQPGRAGFDSLVQAESGISLIESPDAEVPGVLPAQALDHSAGYLLAAAVCRSLARQARNGGTWHISTSLRRIAAELLGMPRLAIPAPEQDIDVAEHVAHFDVAGRLVVTSRPALPDTAFAAPRPWGADQARW